MRLSPMGSLHALIFLDQPDGLLTLTLKTPCKHASVVTARGNNALLLLTYLLLQMFCVIFDGYLGSEPLTAIDHLLFLRCL